jgi:hypothetical protein
MIWVAAEAEISPAFIGAVVLFLLLFVFLPKLVLRGMKADPQAAIVAFGKNEPVNKSVLDSVRCNGREELARVVDPVTAQQVVGILPIPLSLIDHCLLSATIHSGHHEHDL